jgi:hypothetical protein
LPLAALILCEDDAEEGALPATFPITGQSLLEYDVRHARALGAGHIVVLADRLPSSMMQAVERLNAAGVKIEIVRDARTAAEAIHPEEDLLLIAGNVLATPAQLAVLAARETPCLVTIADAHETLGFERIDAKTRWVGLARLDGAILRETASLLGDWQLSSTLLRVAVQRGVARIDPISPESVMRLTSLEDARRGNALVAKGLAQGGNEDWLERLLLQPVVAKLTGVVFNRNMPSGWLSALALALLVGAIGLAAMGWLGYGLLALILAILPLRLARIIMASGAIESKFNKNLSGVLPAISCLSVAAYGGFALWQGDALKCVLAFWCASSFWLVQTIDHKPAWAIGVASFGLLILPFALVGNAPIGLALAIAYCLATQLADALARKREKSQV